ncbi:serine/threonine protein kinase, partial [Mycobacterium rufum]|nr:serine/threonine protein kinase [Mycolicibacterium rufum]
TGRAPAATSRTRTTGSHHRSAPPARRTFSSGQRALLWAAGVLGALAIVIAILIVLNAQDRKDRAPSPATVTETPSQSGTAETPAAAPAAIIDHENARLWVIRPPVHAPPTAVRPSQN